MSVRVNPERTRRYLKRTLARPERSIHLTIREVAENEGYWRKWERGEDPAVPRFHEWRARIKAYCEAKSIREVEFFVQDNHDMTKTITWEPK